MKNYYELLAVAPEAPADEIKTAFRREIARYHPDKVQHLGQEFQQMAVGIAAALTEAYRILMDPALRARYDDELRAAPPVVPPATPAADAAPAVAEPAPIPPPERRRRAGLDLVRKAALSKIREAMHDVLPNAEPITLSSFDVAVVTRPKKGLFRKTEETICLLIKFVARVDAESIASVWPAALRASAPGASGCVLLLISTDVAPARELAAAVTEQRRRLRNPGGVLVPVDVRDWDALFPPETPAPVRAVIQRLKSAKS